MRFHLGPIPSSADFVPDASWRSLREPTPWLAQFMAFPIGIFGAAVIAFLWIFLTPLREAMPTITISGILLAFVGITVVHELTHAVVHPQAGHSAKSILGCWPSRLLFYAHFDGELTRNRFVTILLMPLFIISILPLLIAAAVQVTSGWAAFVSSFNALMACVDILCAGMILYQVPAAATVRNQGWKTYWRL